MLYRIKMEVLDQENGHPLPKSAQDGIECDGFVLMLKRGENVGKNIVFDVNTMDMANMIAGDDNVMAPAIIAKALRDAHDIQYGISKTLSKIASAFADE